MKTAAHAHLRIAFALISLAASVMGSTYTLDQVIKAGIENSKQLAAIKVEMRKVDAQVAEAYGSALPTISAGANWSYAFASYSPYSMGSVDFAGLVQNVFSSYARDTSLTQEQKDIGPGITLKTLELSNSMFPDLSPKDQTLALTLSLQQPVFAQGKVGLGLKIATVYRRGLKAKYAGAEQSVRASLTRLFYATLLAQKNLDAQTEALRLARESHRLTVVRMQVGKGSELDTLISRLALETAIINERSAQSQRIMANEALMKQADLAEPEQEFSVEGEFPSDDYAIGLADALQKMETGNQQLVQLTTGQEVQDLLVDVSKSDYWPMVYAGASVGKIFQYNSAKNIDFTNKNNNDAKISAGVSWTLFSGARRMQKVKQARADRETFDITRKQAIDGLELAVNNAYQQIETARKQLASAQALLKLAEKGYAISKTAYEVGTITLVDFQKRELDLASARIAHNAAKFAFHSAVVDMKVLTGEF